MMGSWNFWLRSMEADALGINPMMPLDNVHSPPRNDVDMFDAPTADGNASHTGNAGYRSPHHNGNNTRFFACTPNHSNGRAGSSVHPSSEHDADNYSFTLDSPRLQQRNRFPQNALLSQSSARRRRQYVVESSDDEA